MTKKTESDKTATTRPEATAAEQQLAQKGLAGVNNNTLKAIITNESTRPETRHRAIAELHKRPGGTLSGLDMLDDQTLARLCEDDSLDEKLRLAAADVLALR